MRRGRLCGGGGSDRRGRRVGEGSWRRSGSRWRTRPAVAIARVAEAAEKQGARAAVAEDHGLVGEQEGVRNKCPR